MPDRHGIAGAKRKRAPLALRRRSRTKGHEGFDASSFVFLRAFVVSNGASEGTLAKPASEILLSDIYQAVKQHALLGKSNNPNPACPVGKEINARLDDLYSEAELFVLQKLGKKTLADFASQFN